MQLYCPTCRHARPLGLRCAECDTRLVAAGEAHDAVLTGRGANPLPAPPPAPGAAGRVVVGVVAALGTVLALRDLALGVVGGALGTESAAAAAPALNLTFATVGAMVGGLLAGAGLARGALGGGFAGACVGILLTSAAAHAGDRPPLGPVDLGVAAALTAVGALAGRAGSRVWPPALALPKPQPKTRGSSVARLVEQAAAEAEVRPPTKWFRVAVGAAMLALGVWHADGLRAAATTALMGRVSLRVATPEVVAGVIAVWAAALGGVVAGAVTHAGWRHGFYAGLAGAAALAAVLASGDARLAVPVRGLQTLLGPLPGGGFAVVLATVALSTAGGAFGAALLPVLGKQSARRVGD